MGQIVATVGHSTHSADDFVALLRAARIQSLVDVRRFPSSRRHPHFNAAQLERALGAAGIDYLHLEALGGRRDPVPGSPNGGWRIRQFQGYADHMASPEFQEALARLIELSQERRCAVMCAEAQWWRCHRRLLSDALLVPGARVAHLDARGGSPPHELTDFAVVDAERLTYPPAQEELEL
jgi:uncharacterized protein (DUF488 family)